LKGADLSKIKLINLDLSGVKLSDAKSVKGAILSQVEGIDNKELRSLKQKEVELRGLLRWYYWLWVHWTSGS
jgi:hypothetical protein